MELVAEYQGKPSLDQYANILFQAGKNMELVFIRQFVYFFIDENI